MNCDNQFVCSSDLKGKLSIRQEPKTPGDNHSIQMKAVQNVNKVLCQEYNSLETNCYYVDKQTDR